MILVTEVLCIKGLLIPAELLMQHRETLFQYGFSFEQLGYPPPVQPFQQRRQLRSRQVHHPVFDPGPAEDAVLQPFGEQTKSGAVPEDQLDPVRPSLDILHTVFVSRRSLILGIHCTAERSRCRHSGAARI
jgi:hypothetical protein